MEKHDEKYPIVKALLFGAVVVLWIALDQLSKSQFSGAEPGAVLAGPFLGLIDIRLVHNTGGAWGIFAGSTFALGIFSVVVCIAISMYYLVTIRSNSLLTSFAFALIVAGGIGNAIDRFAQGFVCDFIEFSFMDFPVFNVADVGVTCGFALLIISMLVEFRASSNAGAE